MKYQKLILSLVLAGTFLLSGCGSDKGTSVMPISPPEDDAPPMVPSGLEAPKVDGDGFLLTWAPNTEADFSGYQVWIYDPSPFRDDSYKLYSGETLVTRPRFVFHLEMEEEVYVRVSAVDAAGNESSRSEPIHLLPNMGPVQNSDSDPNGRDQGRGDPVADPAPDHDEGGETDQEGGVGRDDF